MLASALISNDRKSIIEAQDGCTLRGWQLLHQRQAHRRGGGPAALRRRARRSTNDKAGSYLNPHPLG
ncbi:MAG: hypothetical protein IPJ85_05380 [Flavobacteriales bacterium]|nr:hypothetical protein [Flavobacteriales bacterium]